MLINKEVLEKCKCCGKSTQIITPETYGCDQCKKQIDIDGEFLELTVFYNDHDRGFTDLQFCSWVCCLQRLEKVKTDYFITLPTLTFNNRSEKGLRAKDFFAAVKAFK